MDKLQQFFENNQLKIGEGKDYEIKPPVYYWSLSDAFYRYCLTFRDVKQTYLELLDKISSTKEPDFILSTGGAKRHIAFTILGFHRFFELLLKDILRRINPFLAVKFIEKDRDIFLYLNSTLSADDLKTIEFNDTFNRFIESYNHHKSEDRVYLDILKDFEFLKKEENKTTLKWLTHWRNRIMHNGTTLPNLFAFDYLISQRVIPLIKEIILAEKENLDMSYFYYFSTVTGINLLDEINNINYNFSDFDDLNKREALKDSLLKLGYLKEIGRASYNYLPFSRKNHSYHEPDHENIHERAESYAHSEKSQKNFHAIKRCLCCGLKTLVVYKKEILSIFSDEREVRSWFRCCNCDFSLEDNLPDPHNFGFGDSKLFAT